jgi:hypothetical protein
MHLSSLVDIASTSVFGLWNVWIATPEQVTRSLLEVIGVKGWKGPGGGILNCLVPLIPSFGGPHLGQTRLRVLYLLVCNFLSPSCYSMHCRVTYVLLNRQIHTTIGTTMLFQYTIIFIFNVLHVSSSLNSSSGTVYELSLKLHMASQYTLKIKCCTQL